MFDSTRSSCCLCVFKNFKSLVVRREWRMKMMENYSIERGAMKSIVCFFDSSPTFFFRFFFFWESALSYIGKKVLRQQWTSQACKQWLNCINQVAKSHVNNYWLGAAHGCGCRLYNQRQYVISVIIQFLWSPLLNFSRRDWLWFIFSLISTFSLSIFHFSSTLASRIGARYRFFTLARCVCTLFCGVLYVFWLFIALSEWRRRNISLISTTHPSSTHFSTLLDNFDTRLTLQIATVTLLPSYDCF